jgi:nucleoside-diphosphate-sugar epimerase
LEAPRDSVVIHLEDAAAATVLALEQDVPAVYNIVDDEPAATRVWLPEPRADRAGRSDHQDSHDTGLLSTVPSPREKSPPRGAAYRRG